MFAIFLAEGEINMNDFDRIRLEMALQEDPSLKNYIKSYVSILKNNLIEKVRYTAGVLAGKRTLVSKKYKGEPRVSQQMVEENPEQYVIRECLKACQILWDKNIYTFMCSDPMDTNAWIELKIDGLSLENKLILEEIKKDYRYLLGYHSGCINIYASGMGRKASLALIAMAERFKDQDVPLNEATISKENLLMECGCYREVANPDYFSPEQYFKALSEGEIPNYTTLDFNEKIRVFDETKVKQPLENYIDEYGAIYDSESGLIYQNNFHYQKHLNYLKKQQKKTL